MKFINIYRWTTGCIYATFSNVGQGNGNYKIKENNALGKVYEWVVRYYLFGDIVKTWLQHQLVTQKKTNNKSWWKNNLNKLIMN